MLSRALFIWGALLGLAFVNGALRELWIKPAIGDTAGHAVSSLTLSTFILAASYLTVDWIHPMSARDALGVGLLWVSLTLAFEFLAGHFLFGRPWTELLADYNVLAGRIWVIVLITTLLAPWLTASGRRLF